MNPVCRMHSRFFLLNLALLLSACASTVTLKSTETVRNATIAETSATTRFKEIQPPSSENPNLEIAVIQRITREQTFQRRYVEKKALTPGARMTLLLGGAAAAGVGYNLYLDGQVVLGRNLMGLGLLVPMFSGVLSTGKVIGEEWQAETKALPPGSEPVRDTPVTVSAGATSWTARTDPEGKFNLDISTLVDRAVPGSPLAINLALQEDPTKEATFFIPTDVLAHYQPPPLPSRPSIPIVFDSTEIVEDIIIEEQRLESFEWQPPAEDKPTLAILDFEGLGISEQEARVLTNRLGTHLVQLGHYRIIERGQMQQILQEQDFQISGCTSIDCAVEIGQLLGCEQMLAGSFGKLGSMYTIDMRIIDVGTGGILRTTSYDVRGGIDLLLTEGLAEAAQRITSSP